MTQHTDNLTYGASPKIFENANALKKEMTVAEKILWEAVRNRKLLGFKFRRQHPVDIFVADFYCHELKLVIEVDGGIHDSEENIERDTGREFEMRELGIKTIRFKNEEIENNIGAVLAEISKHLTSV